MNEVRERVFEECRTAGEEVVKQRINDRIYNRQKQTYAEEWLEAQARLRNESLQSEQMEIARSAKDAAWSAANAARDAAREAKTANTIATLAAIAAVIAITVSVIGLFLR